MKTLFTLLLTIGLFLNANAKGIPIPVCFPCEEIHTVQELPDSEDLIGESGEKLNLGYMYAEYGVVWIPVWNTDGTYILTNEAEDTYYEIDEEFIAELKEVHGVEIPSGNPLSLWKKIGGKVLIFIIAGFLIWGQFGDDDEDETAEA